MSRCDSDEFEKSSEVRSNRKAAMSAPSPDGSMKLLAATLRFEVARPLRHRRPGSTIPPVIYASGTTAFSPSPPPGTESAATTARPSCSPAPATTVTMVARAMAVFGLGSVRGSSSRRGVAALVGLKRALRKASTSASRPTVRAARATSIQPGVIKLAESTGAPIIPDPRPILLAWRLKTWDRFVIPKPFSRVDVIFDEAHACPRGMEADTSNTTPPPRRILLARHRRRLTSSLP